MKCPICKNEVTARHDPKSPNEFFPFCSSRCRTIDLGRWLGGKYQIPDESSQDPPPAPSHRPPDRDADD
jgi:hypothetical protein